MTENKSKSKTIKYAFTQSLPVLFGYIPLGIAFGIMLSATGYNALWAFFIGITCYSGSLQYAMVGLISENASIYVIVTMTLFIQIRHIFYGISLIKEYKRCGFWRRLIMIFGLTDETYSLQCALKCPDNVNESDCRFYISVMNHIYWLCGNIIGCLVGTFIQKFFGIDFSDCGIDFVMTALFIVLTLEGLLSAKSKIPTLVGLISGSSILLLFRIFFNSTDFIFPALCCATIVLLLFKPHLYPLYNDEKAIAEVTNE